MNNKDLSTIIDDVKLNIRVGAIIEYQNKILLEKNKNVNFGVIPGGRIKTLENSITSLIREIEEEIGINIKNENFELISLIENFFTFNNNNYHELYFVYKIKLQNKYEIKNEMPNIDNKDAKYYLLTKEEFQNENIMPTVLKEIINNKKFKHYIIDEINK